ncbi:MAG TPA: Uma2 family endonuclease [Candidatus Obscuribacterales bacterium]
MSIVDHEPANLQRLEKPEEFDDIIFPEGNLWSEEPALESYLHLQQLLLLLKCLDWYWRDRHDYFAAGNLTVYFSPNQKKSQDFRGPDFLVVLNTEQKPRRSWVIWEEGKYPNIIIELLSPSTAEIDKGLKKQLYQDNFRTFDYFWFDPDTLELAGFHLVEGKYQPLEPNAQGWLWSQQLELFLGLYNSQLRFFTSDGQLLPTPEEAAIAAEILLAKYREQFGELP